MSNGYCLRCGKVIEIAHWKDEDFLLCQECVEERYNNEFIRYYKGRHKIEIIKRNGKKQLIRHLEPGYVGNKDIGYKKVNPGDIDNTMVRMCERRRR